LFPRKIKEFKKKPEKETKKKPFLEKDFFKSLVKNRGISGAILFFKDIIYAMYEIILETWDSTYVDRFFLDLSLSGSDNASTGILYGQACTVIYPIYQVVFKNKSKKKVDIKVRPDFKSDKIRVKCDIKLRLRPVKVLFILLKSIIKHIDEIKVLKKS
jgi:hypothetical protein